MDVDGNGAVNFPEFFNATSPQIGGAISEDDLFQSFTIIDKNSDGFISEAEFAGTIGPSPIPTDTQPPTNIEPSPETSSSALRSFCEEYPWNSLCKDRPGWTGIKPDYPSLENTEPSPVIIESPSVTVDPLPDISTASMDMLCEQYPWNDLCKDRPGWTGIEPIYKAQDVIGPSPMSTGPSPTTVTSTIDSLCEKYPWNDLCRDRPGWTGIVPNGEFDAGDTTTTPKTSSEKGYEALSSGRYADALIEYTNALSIASDSEKPLLYNNRSIAYMRMGQFDSALRDANNIDATIDANKLLRYTRTADALYGLERFTEAKNSYQLAIDMNPSSDNLILGLQRAERAENLTASTSTPEEAGTYTFTSDSTQGAYNSALTFTESSGTTQVTENSTERAEQSAIDVLCATTFWHEMCKDRPGWTGTPPDENIPTVDNTVLDTICEPNTGTAPWLEICSYQQGWTGERPIETSGSTQTDVISYTDYSSGLADISQSGGTGVIQVTEEQSNDTEDQSSLSKWKYIYDRDVLGGAVFDTFALSPNTETKANMETCLMKCNEQDYCKGVVFNDTFDRCWGKSSVTDTEKNPDRILYTKTVAADGILEPWNQELPTPPTLRWRYVPDTDVDKTKTPWEGATFHYTPQTDIKASPEVCITKCAEQSDCEGVVFNQENTLCWGMREATVQHTKYSAARNLYRKTYESDGILKPWTQMSITSTMDAETETPDVEPTKWTFDDGVDVISDFDTFQYTLETDPKANFENCIRECDNQSYCTAVVFNEDKTKCWGKLNAVGRRTAPDRSLYTKTDDVNGISEPWNFCSNDENMLHPMCKPQLDEKCATNITDPKCAGYSAYDAARKKELDEKCATNIIDKECAGYQAYDNATEQRELDEYCALETIDSKCAGYSAYEAAREAEKLDAKCTENPTHTDCADRPGYEEAIAEAVARQNTFWKFKPNYDARGSTDTFHYYKNSNPKASLEVCLRRCNDQGDDCAGVVFDAREELCWGKSSGYNAYNFGGGRKLYEKTDDPSNIKEPWNFCSKKINISDPYCKPQLDAYCLNEDKDDLCAEYPAYKAKKELDEKCETDTTDPKCAGYQAYEAKKKLDADCETNTTDPKCAGYPAYDDANTFWNYRPGYDAGGSSDTFHYHKNSNPKASLEVCLRRCNDQGDDCAGVVFDTREELCWGKSSGYNAYIGGERKLYEKTDDPSNMKEPWNFCSENGNLSDDPYCKPQLDAYCLNEDKDDLCAGYSAYDTAEAKRQLDAYCLNEVKDEKCADYPAYKAKKELDEYCALETLDSKCEDYPMYKASAWWREALAEMCKTDTTDPRCAGYQAYDAAEAKRQLDADCETNTTDPKCAGYQAYEAKKKLDAECETNTTDPKCAGYPAYDDAARKKELDKKCEGWWVTRNPPIRMQPDTTDPKCAGYPAYDTAEAKRQLDADCETNTTDPKCAGYQAYEAKKKLDADCETNTTDPKCAGYPAYDDARKKELDEKCETDTTDPKCVGYPAYDDANSFWNYRPGIDVGGTYHETFRYFPGTYPEGTQLETCLRRCKYQGDRCGGVVFEGDSCWGKHIDDVTRHAYPSHLGNRNLYEKTRNPSPTSVALSALITPSAPMAEAEETPTPFEVPFCDIPENVLDPKCPDYDMAMSIADELDDEILTEVCKDSISSNGEYTRNALSACRKTATEWNPDDPDMSYRCGFGEWGNPYWDSKNKRFTRKLVKKFGNTKCPNDHCCDMYNWCSRGTESGQPNKDLGCFMSDGKGGYTGIDEGRFDGDDSRQEADKIARRSKVRNFLDVVRDRVRGRKQAEGFDMSEDLFITVFPEYRDDSH